MISKPRSLVVEDLKKVGKGAAIAGFGAAALYLLDALPNVDFGDWTPFMTAVLAVVGNLFRKWWTRNKY